MGDKTDVVASDETRGERELLPLVLEALQSENLCAGGACAFAVSQSLSPVPTDACHGTNLLQGQAQPAQWSG